MRHFFNSMRGRLFLLLLLGTSGSALVTFLIAHNQQEEILRNARAQNVASNIATLVETIEATAPLKRNEVLDSMHPIGVRGSWIAEPAAAPAYPVDAVLQQALRDNLDQRHSPYASSAGSVPCRRLEGEHAPRYPHEPQCQLVLIKLSDDTTLRLTAYTPPRLLTPPRPAWWVPLLFFLLIAVLTFLAARIATRPLQQLADAADGVDLTEEGVPLAEHGSSEVRAAIRAFNRMRQRIRDDLRERTGMLAAISHDLQTPLTRLRLRLEKVSDDELRDKLIADMNATQQMVQEGLEFARSLDSHDGMQTLDLDSLLDSLCSDASDSGQDVRYTERTPARVLAQPLSLRRAISNLLDNAVKYGRCAEVALHREERHCHILIRDQGTGMPAEELERVFAPFYRIEQSRSRETGGSGLGLAIARNIVRQHGGSISLSNRSEGGLEADITLPLAS